MSLSYLELIQKRNDLSHTVYRPEAIVLKNKDFKYLTQ